MRNRFGRNRNNFGLVIRRQDMRYRKRLEQRINRFEVFLRKLGSESEVITSDSLFEITHYSLLISNVSKGLSLGNKW